MLLIFTIPGAAAAQSIVQDLTNSTVSLNNNAFGQSFTATEASLSDVTVFVADFNPHLGAYGLQMQLFEGEGYGGTLLGTRGEVLPNGFSGAWKQNFSGVELVAGAQYSIRVSSASGRGGIQLNQHSFPGGGAINVDYVGGHLLAGAGGAPNTLFDLRFRVDFDDCTTGFEQNLTNSGVSLNGNVFGQSFRPTQPKLDSITVFISDFNPFLGAYDIRLDVFAGVGYGGALLFSSTQTLPNGHAGGALYETGSLAVVPGADYTFRVSSASGRGGIQINQHSFPGGGAINVDYPGGDLLTGAAGTPNPLFDTRFRVEGHQGGQTVAQGFTNSTVSLNNNAFGQSFVAEGGQLDSVTTFLADFNAFLGAYDIRLELFAGVGYGGALLSSQIGTLPNGFAGAWTVAVDASLVEGDTYTIRVSSASGRGGVQINQHSFPGGGAINVDYAGGHLLTGAGGAPNTLFDMRFRLEFGASCVLEVQAGELVALCGDDVVPITDDCTVEEFDDGSVFVRCDGICFDATDACPDDPELAPGACGCGVADDDTDGDGTLDCEDACPADPAKTAAGMCGCGVADTDSDGDGSADCVDVCPDDADKAEPGACGCGVPDTDGDGDGTPDCLDACPADAGKTEPGICDCGTSDGDSDGDGEIDCFDGCPNDPTKVSTGVCGCGVVDFDGDGDGAMDCVDFCFEDPNKVDFGICGCGEVDTDSDGDGVADCVDFCFADPNKVDFGVCGCGVPDVDINGDGQVFSDECGQIPCAAPIADAGPDQAKCDTKVTLDGSGSVSECGGLTYSWSTGEKALGQGAQLSTDVGPGHTTVMLTVCDNQGQCDTDEVEISAGSRGPWAYPDEITLTNAYNRLYCSAYVEADRCGLDELVSDKGQPYPELFTVADIAEIQVVAYDTSGVGPLWLEVLDGGAGGQFLLFDPGPWTAPSRGWLPDAGSPTIDLAAALVANGFAANSDFRFRAGNAVLTSANTYLLDGDEPGEWLVAVNDGGLHGGDADANEPVFLAMAPIDEQLEACPAGSTIIVGTNGPDALFGTPGPDCIFGLGGNDTIVGSSGDDVIFGGRGNDNVNASRGADYVYGGSCHDTIRGREDDDTLEGGSGNDVIDGGGGNDVVRGGVGDDRLTGSGGNDVVEGGDGDDIVAGNDGDDFVSGGAGKDDVRGGNGNDTIDGGEGDDAIQGNPGRDVIDGGPGYDKINGGDNFDICINGEELTNCEG